MVIARLSKRWSLFWNERRVRVIASAITVGIAIGCALLPIAGNDWYTFFTEYARNPAQHPYPVWIYFVIGPLSRLPNSFAFYTALSAAMIITALALVEKPSLLLVLTLPITWILFYGQIDGWLVLGAVLGLWSLKHEKPFLLGLALVLLASKPHIGLPLALLLLVQGWNPRVLVVPALVLAVSLMVYGFWLIEYLQTFIRHSQAGYAFQNVNTSLYPWAFALLPLIAWRWKKLDLHARAVVVLAATGLMISYCPIYSLSPLLFLTSSAPALGLLALPMWFGGRISAVSGSLFALASLLYFLLDGSKALKRLRASSSVGFLPGKPADPGPVDD